MKRSLYDTTTITATDHQISITVSGETVIMDSQGGMYYSLDNVGAYIWSLIQEPTQIGKVRAAVLETYEVSAEQLEQDLTRIS